MNNVIPFDFAGKAIRVIDRSGEPWFVAADVADVLGYAKTRNAISRHCKGGTTAPKQGGGSITIIPERDVYRLIMRSKLPEAERFEEWVVGEVLPSIRKNGGYIAQQESDTPEMIMARAIKIAETVIQEKDRLISEQTMVIQQSAPKVAFHDQVAAAPDAISISEAAKIIGTGRRRLFSFLRAHSWVTRKNEPYQAMIERGYMDVKLGNWEHPDHGLQQSVTALVTGKGLVKLQRLWEESHAVSSSKKVA